MLYGAAAILTGLSFILKKEIPRNIGFIALALFLTLDGINVEQLAFDIDYPRYYFAVNSLLGFLSAIFFSLQKATWKNIGFGLLVGFIFTNSVAGLLVYNSDLSYIFLIIASLFAIPAAILFLTRK
jgi:hypothetical protein